MSVDSRALQQGQSVWRTAVLLLSIMLLLIVVDNAIATYPLMVDAWLQQQKLTADDAAANDYFGYGVALDGNTAVIGAPQDDDHGAAYVFVHDGTGWSQQAKLTADDAAVGDNFGWTVALDGDTAVIGAPQYDDDGNGNGSAYVFVRSGTSWSQQAKLTANDAAVGDNFGWTVALDGDTTVIGAPQDDDDGNGSGSTYVFIRNDSSWSQQAKLTADDAAANDTFGFAVTLDSDTVVIGAWEDDDEVGVNSGSAYVFVRSGTSWSQQARLIADDAAQFSAFGWAVALENDTAAIGAVYPSNSAYIFVRNGISWSQQTKLIPSDPTVENDFGNDVALFGNTAIVGAPGDDDGSASGSVYAFTFTPPANLSIDDVSLAEGNAGTIDFIFTVTRTDNSEAVSVDFSTADSTATIADSDYITNSGTINFLAGGDLTSQITIQVKGDVKIEPDETFFVNLSHASEGAIIADSQGMGTIQNDDNDLYGIFLPMIISQPEYP